jgi:hypothetical protein
VCTGIALALSEFPQDLVAALPARRIHERGGEKEARFLYRDPERLLPVWVGGQLQLVRWGRGRGGESTLPVQGGTWEEKVDSGWWKDAGAEPVDIAATGALANGVWYFLRQGIRGWWCRMRATRWCTWCARRRATTTAP